MKSPNFYDENEFDNEIAECACKSRESFFQSDSYRMSEDVFDIDDQIKPDNCDEDGKCEGAQITGGYQNGQSYLISMDEL